MKLKVAVTHFHRTVVQDAYNLTSFVRGRLMPMDDAMRDSLAADRRILALGDGVDIPARRTIMIEGQAYLVGDESLDLAGNEVLHRKLVLHKTDYVAQVRTFYEALTNTGTRDLWAARLWVKAMKEPDESAGLFETYQIFFSREEDLTDSRSGLLDGENQVVLVKIENRWHLVRSVNSTAGGFQCAIADELPEPLLSTVSFQQSSYDPLTDATTTSSSSVSAIFMRWQSHFKYQHLYSTKYKAGDAIAIILKTAATPKADDKVVVAGHTFRVISVADEDPMWSLHLRND